MPDAHTNFAYSTVLTAPSPATSGTSVVVQSGDGAKFPAASFNCVICPTGQAPTTANAEIVRVTVKATDTFTITRAQESSTARSVIVGDQIYAAQTVRSFTDIENYMASELQNGVIASGDAAISATSVNSGTGVITLTLAAANPIWIANTSGVLVPLNYAGVSGGTLTPGALPATTKFRGYGIEIDTAGALTIVSGTDQATLALALTNANSLGASGRIRVADIVLLNTAGVYSIPAGGNPRDRRPWARGAFGSQSDGTNRSTASTTNVAISASLVARVECTGVPLRLNLNCAYGTNSTGATNSAIAMLVDLGVIESRYLSSIPTANYVADCDIDVIYSPSAGSRLFQPYFLVSAGTVTLQANIYFAFEELVRQNANNGTS